MTDQEKTNSINANYIFQKNNYNSYQCGAYAIYNLLQHRGCKNIIKLKYLIRKCKARKGIGTLVEDFNATLESSNSSKHVKPIEPTLINIKSSIHCDALCDAFSPIIILFLWYHGAHKGNHYALIDKMYPSSTFKYCTSAESLARYT